MVRGGGDYPPNSLLITDLETNFYEQIILNLEF